MNRVFLLNSQSLFVFMLLHISISHMNAQLDTSEKVNICKRLAINSAQSANRSYDYAQKNYFETKHDIIEQNIDTALFFIKESISFIDSALVLASDSEVIAIEHSKIARNLEIDSYRTLRQLKLSDFNGRKELAIQATLYCEEATVEAYHASLYFKSQRRQLVEEVEKKDSVILEKQVTKLDIDQTLFTLLKFELTEKLEASQQESRKLSTELQQTEEPSKISQIKSQMKVLDDRIINLDKKTHEVEQRLMTINTLLEDRDKNVKPFSSQKDTIFSKGTLKTTTQWNNNIASDSELPMSLVYQVQLGVFKKAVLPDRFKGLTPIFSKSTKNGVCYTTGLFERFADAEEAKKTVQSIGLKDVFVIAYFNKQKITLADALKLETK